ncbi:MAG: archaeal proteasome endopeptidase complex subunit beta [Candidatus Aenigmarchaeota archaeon]|nr:archaeal proteasome endopeptidase complex subunit beta [Candidatus Aenigmarchaeota archaeon]
MTQAETMKTGTTTVGLICKDCVVLAADSKSTMGYLVASKIVQKIQVIDNMMAVTIAGGIGDNQQLLRVLKAEINLYRLTRNADVTVKATATLLSNILQGNRYYPYMAMLILGGMDKEGYHLYSIDPAGGVEPEKYTSTGSGSPMAFGVLENEFKEGMTREEGIKLATRAVRSAKERDIFSGGDMISVVVIDAAGTKFVDQEKIKQIAK